MIGFFGFFRIWTGFQDMDILLQILVFVHRIKEKRKLTDTGFTWF
jgi:hypothetical protein